eukprot:1557542-Alexandrium_andersonii.AAC.1
MDAVLEDLQGWQSWYSENPQELARLGLAEADEFLDAEEDDAEFAEGDDLPAGEERVLREGDIDPNGPEF